MKKRGVSFYILIVLALLAVGALAFVLAPGRQMSTPAVVLPTPAPAEASAPVVDGPNKTYRYVLQTGRGYQKTAVDLSFVSKYKSFYDDLKNTNKTEDW